jgi:hypothetical protein
LGVRFVGVDRGSIVCEGFISILSGEREDCRTCGAHAPDSRRSKLFEFLKLRSSHLPVLKLRFFEPSHFGPSQLEDASHLPVLELRFFEPSHFGPSQLEDASHLTVLELRFFEPSHFGPSQLEDASHLTVLELRFFEPSHFAFSLAPALRPVAEPRERRHQ